MLDLRERAIAMSEKILIVDDQALMLRLLALPLEQDGYTIVTAMNGAEALHKIQTDRPDLVILDLMLPDTSGIEVCHRIRQAPALAELPIIILSGQTELSAKIQGLEAGADEYVTKPVDPKEMVARVRGLLARTQRLRQPLVAAPTRQGRIIALIGAKGGVGTTTLAANLATALSLRRQRTVAVELRSYYGTLARHFKASPASTLSTLAELTPSLIGAERVSACLHSTAQGLQLLCGPQRLKDYRDMQPEQVSALLGTLASQADFVIVDLPHLPSTAGRAALRAAQSVLVVVEPEASAVAAGQALIELLSAWSIPNQALKVVVVNRIQAALAQPPAEIERALGCEVLGTVTAAPDQALSALVMGIPMVQSAPTTLVASTLVEIAGRVAALQPVGR
jgi:DNA-binding response OmpR family regulator